MADNRYAVKLRRTTVETATVMVDAPNQRNATFLAAQQSPEWAQLSAKVEVDEVEGAEG